MLSILLEYFMYATSSNNQDKSSLALSFPSYCVYSSPSSPALPSDVPALPSAAVAALSYRIELPWPSRTKHYAKAK